MDPKESCLFLRNVFNRRSWTFISWGVWITVGGSYWLVPRHSLMASVRVGLLILVVIGETGWMLRSILLRASPQP